MKKRYIFAGIAGILGPVIYLFAVIFGGVITEDYNHTTQAISELTSQDSPHRLILNIIFNFSLLMTAIFAINSFKFTSKLSSKLIRAGAGIFVVITALSMLWVFFPMDPIGEEATINGIIHLILAGIVSPLTITSPLLIGIGFLKIQKYKVYAFYSIVSGVLIFVTGVLTLISAQNGAINLGIYERLTIGSYQQWILGSAIFSFYFPKIRSLTIVGVII